MKVFVVKVLWRNDEDFGCDVELFSTYEKAKEYFDKNFKWLLQDYSITEDNKCLAQWEDEYEYTSGDFDYFYTFITEKEVQ